MRAHRLTVRAWRMRHDGTQMASSSVQAPFSTMETFENFSTKTSSTSTARGSGGGEGQSAA